MPTATPYFVRVLDASWRGDTNYEIGALKFHNNKYWQALQPSGPDNGGAKEPGTDGAVWADTSNITYSAGTGISLSGNTFSVDTSWLAQQIPTPDTNQYLPLYFTADSLELHTFVPANAKTVRYEAIEADGSGTSGLTLKMTRDIGATTSMNVTSTAADCSAYAKHSVTFSLSGVGNQTEIACMVVFA